MIKRTTILICLLFTSKQCFAEPVEPIFSGIWYSEALFIGHDNCNTEMYEHLNQNSNPEAFVESYMRTLPTTSGCTWSIEEQYNEPYDAPRDFPGEYDAYQQVLAENEPATTYYYFACRLGDKFEDGNTLYLYPKYICPTGSRDSYDENAGYWGCTNTPELCDGDVVTRSLNISGLSSAGHSGITDNMPPKNEVYNVLPAYPLTIKPTANLITTTRFADFYNMSEYWGDEYGVPEQPILTSGQGSSIILSTWENMDYKALYTYFTEFTPAESFESAYTYDAVTNIFQKIIINKIEKWRCDTFADWVYYEGTGKMPLSFAADPDHQGSYEYTNSTYLPVDLYANLINTRDNGIDGQIPNPEIGTTKDDGREQVLFNYAAKMNKVVKNTLITRDERLQTLVQLLNEQPDDEHYSIVADALASLHPIEKTELILQQYNKDDSVSKKQWILYMLESASELRSPTTQENNIVKIQDFLSKIITSETDPSVLESVVHAYNNVMPFSQDKVDTISQALNSIPNTPEYNGDKILNQFLLAINSPTPELMEQLIQTMQSSNEASLFQSFISNAIINGLPLSSVSKQTKIDLNDYLESRLKSNQPRGVSASKKQNKIAYPEYYKLIKAYGLLNNNVKLSSNYIMNLSDSVLQAKIVSFSYFDKQNPAVFKSLNQDQLLSSYQNTIKGIPSSNQSRNDDYVAYKSAISILDGSYSKYMQEQVKLYKDKKANH